MKKIDVLMNILQELKQFEEMEKNGEFEDSKQIHKKLKKIQTNLLQINDNAIFELNNLKGIEVDWLVYMKKLIIECLHILEEDFDL
jgi:hypothetical protein